LLRGWATTLTPFFFHTAEQPLYGIYAPPCGPVERDDGVLLCAPIGHEAVRCHWTLRELANDLTAAGYHVLRFDYTGHGDSWGEFEDGSPARWLADIGAALEELRDQSGAGRLSVVGVRLGAGLALAAAQKWPIKHLILWGPVLAGRSFVDELRAMQIRRRRIYCHAPIVQPGADWEDLLGHRYSRAQVTELTAFQPYAGPVPRIARLAAIGSDGVAGWNDIAASVKSAQIPLECLPGDDLGPWDDVERFAEPMLPSRSRRAVIELLAGECQ
jgi:pimeloyl-ACP methyl ester carboxylesterase